MASPNLAPSKARFGASAGLYTLIVIAALVMVNWLANHYNKTYDTTANKRYTLSDETKKIVGNLKSDVTITYFDKPENFDTAKATLERYRNLSSKIQLQYIDLRKDVTTAKSFGVRSVGSTFVQMGAKKEEAKSLTEEGITGALLKVLKEARKVCFVTGSHERQIDETGAPGLSRLKELLARDNYVVDAISLVGKTEIPKDCSVTVVAGPKNDYEQSAVNALKAYVEAGGRAFILLDPPIHVGKMETSDNPALTQLLASWGVTTGKDLILDPAAEVIGAGPQMVVITDFESHPIVNGMKGGTVVVPLVQSLEIKNGDNTTVEKILTSDQRTLGVTKITGEKINGNDPSNKKGPFVLAAAGTLKSGDPNKAGRFVVIGSSSVLENQYVAYESNPDLVVNAINWLSADEDLISIRPKDPEDRRLNMKSSQFSVMVWTVLGGIPLLIIALGISIYLKRR